MLAKRPNSFAIASESEQLPETLDFLATDSEARDRTSQAFRIAAFWPAIAAAGLAAAFVVVSIFVVPIFESLYAGAGMDPPPSLALLSAGAHLLSATWWIVVLGMIALFALWFTGRWPISVTRAVNSILFRVPFVRRYVRERFAMRLSLIVHAFATRSNLRDGAIAHLRATAGVGRLSRAVGAIEASLRGGASLDVALSSDALVPARLSMFAKLGILLDDMQTPFAQAIELARDQEFEAYRRLEGALVVTLYILIGGLVGVYVYSMYQIVGGMAGLV